MPIYEYHCEYCDRSFEALVQTGHFNETQCPSCGGMKLSREMSTFASRAGTAGEANGGTPIPASGSCCGGSCGCR